MFCNILHLRTRRRLASKQTWLNSDGEGESDNNDDDDGDNNDDGRQPYPVRSEEKRDDHGYPTPPTSRSSASPTQTHNGSLDGRPWLLKHSPQWVDFKRRRSSLLSLHFGNRFSALRGTSPQESKIEHLGSSLNLRQKDAVADSRTSMIDQLMSTRGGGGAGGGGGGSDGGHPHAETLSSCSETGQSPVASEAQQPQQLPRFQVTHNVEEKSDKVGASAGLGVWNVALGRHRRTSGIWALDSSTNSSSFSGFSSMSDTIGSNIEVHNFLEESAGSAYEDGGESSRDGTDSGRAKGERGRRDGSGGVGSVDDRRNSDDAGKKDLCAQDIRFLLEGKKLRDALLAVEDLHFSEHIMK